jgi:hypothetical protein
MNTPMTKDGLLRQSDSLRDLARRARHLSTILTVDSDQRRLVRYAEELEENASRLEKEAATAKSMIFRQPGSTPQ